jgi:predicted ATP-dependent endonuclease of OLD family
MKITQISIKNFRLLEDVELCLEDGATVIVGRNNSGKTSLTELFRRLLDEKSPRFKLEDFSLGVYEQFWDAYELYRKEEEEADIRQALPLISTKLNVEYGKDEDFGPLADFVIDVDEECTTAQINIRYALAPGKIDQMFADLDEDKTAFFKALKQRIPKFFEATIEAQDPNDPTNQKSLGGANLRSVLQFAFINAQRALDDASNKEKAVLGKVFEKLFTAASSEAANTDDQATAAALTSAADKVQEQINEGFNEQLKNLAPTFDLFGYPGLTDPKLRTETILKVEQLFSNHTTVGYLNVYFVIG